VPVADPAAEGDPPPVPQPGERAAVRPAKSAFADYQHHGVLELELRPGRWRWSFHALGAETVDSGGTGKGVIDKGEAACH